jgi:hypothetical protein
MNNQKILDNAPEGATHALTQKGGQSFYFKNSEENGGEMLFTFANCGNRWTCFSGFKNINNSPRSLEDIKRIVYLEKRLGKYKEQSRKQDETSMRTGLF